MAAKTPDVGTGASIAFSTSFLTPLLSISVSGISRPALDTTAMSTTTARTFMPGDLYDPGELTCELQWDTDSTPSTPLAAAAETVTITWPDSETMIFSAFMTGFAINAPLEDVMTATATLKISGPITF